MSLRFSESTSAIKINYVHNGVLLFQSPFWRPVTTRGTISTFHALSSGMEREVDGIFLLWDSFAGRLQKDAPPNHTQLFL